jgi:hypothetical protein
VANLSDFVICDVHITPPERAGAGLDWLHQEERLGPGKTKTFPVAAGQWYLHMQDCAKRTLYARPITVRGTQRLEFRPVEVQRNPWFGSRRFARGPRRADAL